jgi:hypothetical protein
LKTLIIKPYAILEKNVPSSTIRSGCCWRLFIFWRFFDLLLSVDPGDESPPCDIDCDLIKLDFRNGLFFEELGRRGAEAFISGEALMNN